jgi:drug/metabolite transporter (DMT)-like permease
MWVIFGLISAIFLGIYDAVRKKVLEGNLVLPVLFLASITIGFLFIPLLIISRFDLISVDSIYYIPHGDLQLHFYAFIKSVIVGSSWFLAYHAISQLPLTIVIPIRSTGPMWTIVGALIIFSERFTLIQWTGILVVLSFFYYFTLAGRHEGINFFRNKWIFAAIGATLLGAVSSMYDKFLFSQYNHMFMQAWYSIYMVPVLAPVVFIAWFPRRKQLIKFIWSPYIHVIGAILLVSDFLYFYSLTFEDSLIAVLSVLRRSSVVISFASGALFFGETNLKRKGLAMLGILVGVILIIMGTLRG